jgi:phage I-like protein/cation transport regulator ChaB
MPYQSLNDLPDAVRQLPLPAQKIFQAAFNAAWENPKYAGDDREQACFAVAWAAVKRQYRQGGAGEWQAIEEARALISLEALPAAAPEWIRLLPLGEVRLADGREPFHLDRAAMDAVINAWQGRGNDLVIDYEHQTMDGGEAPAAGWIKALDARDDGLWARAEWTPRATAYIASREYRYFSPVVTVDKKTRRVTELLHAALTNFPAIANLTPLAARYGGAGGLEVMLLGQGEAGQGKQRNLDKKSKGGRNMLEALKKLLGLKPEADESALLLKVQEAVAQAGEAEGLTGEVAALKDSLAKRDAELQETRLEAAQLKGAVGKVAVPMIVTQTLGLAPDAAAERVITSIEALKVQAASGDEARSELKKLRDQMAHDKAETMVQEALRTGRTSPEELERNGGTLKRLAFKDAGLFETIVMSRPEGSVVPLAKLRLKEEAGAGAEAMTDIDLAMCKQLGVSPEAYQKAQAEIAARNRQAA